MECCLWQQVRRLQLATQVEASSHLVSRRRHPKPKVRITNHHLVFYFIQIAKWLAFNVEQIALLIACWKRQLRSYTLFRYEAQTPIDGMFP